MKKLLLIAFLFCITISCIEKHEPGIITNRSKEVKYFISRYKQLPLEINKSIYDSLKPKNPDSVYEKAICYIIIDGDSAHPVFIEEYQFDYKYFEGDKYKE